MGISSAVELRIVENRGPLCAALSFPRCCHSVSYTHLGAGEVKLVCAATDKNLDLLRRGRRLWCTEQPESAVIAQIEISDTGEKATMTVRAPLSTNRWARRVAMWTTLVKNVETAMYKLVNDNRRGLPGASAKPMGLTPVTDSQTSSSA